MSCRAATTVSALRQLIPSRPKRALKLDMGPRVECDVLVIGSGVAGLSAAVAAAHAGAHVLVAEREPLLGGTGAISGGWLYLPGTTHGLRQGDSRTEITAYLRALSGPSYFERRVEAFLDTVPEMVELFERETAVRFAYPERAPDYHMELPGARIGGRALYAERFDARPFRVTTRLMRRPMSSMRVFGVVPQIGHDLDQFVAATRSPRAFAYVTGRVAGSALQRALYGCPVDLSNGNALVGRLLASAVVVGVELLPGFCAEQLVGSADEVNGALLRAESGPVEVMARAGVVLASGGFSHDDALRVREFPHRQGDAQPCRSATVASNDGAALRLASPFGASFLSVTDPAAWVPVSVFRGWNGSQRLFPHLRAIGLPGLIVVDRHGRRFANEADSYHDFGRSMIDSCDGDDEPCAFLLADAKAMRRYGLGYAKPRPIPSTRYRLDGYLYVGRTLTELARRAGIDPVRLQRTVEEFNQHAASGVDPIFHRGESAYNRFRGDKQHRPNPTLGALTTAPFYATRIVVGDLGTFSGLEVDEESRVLAVGGTPVSHLYAVGAAAVSVFGGRYPGYGAMLGPGMTFGYRVGRSLSTRQAALDRPGGQHDAMNAAQLGSMGSFANEGRGVEP